MIQDTEVHDTEGHKNTTSIGIDMLASLLRYPSEKPVKDMLLVCEEIKKRLPDVSEEIDEFAQRIKTLTSRNLEELFTRTFDINPVCALEIGWHVYGETYNRGTFMVQMRNTLKDHGVEENGELPDHLSLVLEVLSKMPVPLATSLVKTHVLLALEKMIKGFSNKENPYGYVIRAIRKILCVHYQLEAIDV